jgi:hypothetical protein
MQPSVEILPVNKHRSMAYWVLHYWLYS